MTEVEGLRRERDYLSSKLDELTKENERLRAAVRNQCGDNLCWLTDTDIGKAIPREEFLKSCERYHQQISSERGVVKGCMTIAQLEARIVELEEFEEE